MKYLLQLIISSCDTCNLKLQSKSRTHTKKYRSSYFIIVEQTGSLLKNNVSHSQQLFVIQITKN